jgi:glycosyltransferase involved in cell wall biosynthesis
MPTPDISIVVPVFNEVDSLPVLAAEIRQALAGWDLSYEVVLVDDGSTDGSLAAMLELTAGDARLRVVRFPFNCGQSAAFAAGFRHARGAIVVTLDADLQNDPAEIPRLVAALDGCDVVSGVRTDRQDDWTRRISSRIANRVRSAVTGDGVLDVGCSLKAYRAELLGRVPVFNGMHRFLPALLIKAGARLRQVPVHHRPRLYGEAKYGIGNRLFRGLLDLAGVWWLSRRRVDPWQAVEVEVRPRGRRASSPARRVERDQA